MIFDLKEFQNKKVIVTGSSTGIGFESAMEFLELGANVIFHGNNSIGDLEQRIKERSSSQNFKIIKADFTNLNQVNDFMNEATNHLEGLDILINNAGTMVGRYNLDTITENQFLEIFDLNAKSAFFTTQYASNIFKEKPAEGVVIACGEGARKDSGELIAMAVSNGDKILFGKWSGTEVTVDGEELLIMKESDILGVLS